MTDPGPLDRDRAPDTTDLRADMRAALADPDAWRALSGIIRRFAEHQVRDRNLNEALFGSRPVAAAFAEDRREHANALDELVERTRKAGAIRAEVTTADVRVGLTALASLGTLRHERAAPSTRSLVNLLLAGMSA